MDKAEINLDCDRDKAKSQCIKYMCRSTRNAQKCKKHITRIFCKFCANSFKTILAFFAIFSPECPNTNVCIKIKIFNIVAASRLKNWCNIFLLGPRIKTMDKRDLNPRLCAWLK